VFDDVGAGDSFGLHDRSNAREQFGVGEESEGGHESSLSRSFSGPPLTRCARFDAAITLEKHSARRERIRVRAERL
jgi:hypothetical protein